MSRVLKLGFLASIPLIVCAVAYVAADANHVSVRKVMYCFCIFTSVNVRKPSD